MPKVKLTKKELKLLIGRMQIELDWGDSSIDPEYGIYSHKQWLRMESIRNKCQNALALDKLLKAGKKYHVHSKEDNHAN